MLSLLLLLLGPSAADAAELPLPRNGDGAPCLPEVAERVRDDASERIEARGRRFDRRLEWMVDVAAAEPEVAWAVEAARPGLVWQALFDVDRRWLRLVAGLDPADRARLLDGELVQVRLEGHQGFAEEFFPFAPAGDPLSDPVLQMRRSRYWLGFIPIRVVRGSLAGADEKVFKAMFGQPVWVDRLLVGGRMRRWHERCHELTERPHIDQGPIRVRYSPVHVAESAARALARDMAEHVTASADWLGTTQDALKDPIEVFLWSDRHRPMDLGMPPLSYALPEYGQVHQLDVSSVGHELNHVLTWRVWGPARTEFMREGVAQAHNGSMSLFEWAGWSSMRTRGRDLRELERYAKDFEYSAKGYLTAAFFVQYVEESTPGLVRELYLSPEPVRDYARHLDQSVDELARRFADWAVQKGLAP